MIRPLDRFTRGIGLDPTEHRSLLLMGALVAVLLCAYTIAKVLRDALFLDQFGALSLPYAYLAVALATAGFVAIENQIARRYARIGASRFNQYFAIAFSIAAAAVYPQRWSWTTALFYVWTGSQAMMLLPHFWVLALEVWDSRRARRVFPMLTGFGLVGGIIGGAFAAWAPPYFGRQGLLWSLPVLLLVAHALTSRVQSLRSGHDRPQLTTPSGSPWKTVLRTRYILVLVVSLALSVVIGTLVDFQFKYLVQRSFFNSTAMTQFLGRFYVGLNALSLVLQFGVAGWLLQRLGLGVSNALQPAAIVGLATWAVMAPGMGVVIAMRWSQGVLSQTLGKSTNEIYYAAIRTSVRRHIKPAIDTLVERWSDAAVGVLLIVVLHAFRVRFEVIGLMTAALAALWIAVAVVLDHQYGRAFQKMLSSRWIEPEDTRQAVRTPAARRLLLDALHAEDELRIVLGLHLCGELKDARIIRAVRECLAHSRPAVRAAALGVMHSLGLPDHENRIPGFLDDPDDEVRRVAMQYLLTRGPRSVAFARRVLDGADRTLQRHAVDVLFENVCEARAALTLDWIDARLASDDDEEVMIGARGLGIYSGDAAAQRLRPLLTHPNAEVRRIALLSAARRPARALLDVMLPLLVTNHLHHEARFAIAAVGDPALPHLEPLLDGSRGARAQSVAANTVAQIGTRPAVRVLLGLVRSRDLRSRHLGLRGLARVRVRAGDPVVSRGLVHRLFLRELRDYRECIDAANALESHEAPEVRLLAETWRESADWAVERAIQALACWYEPRPLIGVLEGLRSRDRDLASPALEYLEHVLPRSVFRLVRHIFEAPASPPPGEEPDADPVARRILAAWNSEDGWLRACAVRASRFVPSFDRSHFAAAKDDDPRVRAEIAALGLAGAPC